MSVKQGTAVAAWARAVALTAVLGAGNVLAHDEVVDQGAAEQKTEYCSPQSPEILRVVKLDYRVGQHSDPINPSTPRSVYYLGLDCKALVNLRNTPLDPVFDVRSDLRDALINRGAVQTDIIDDQGKRQPSLRQYDGQGRLSSVVHMLDGKPINVDEHIPAIMEFSTKTGQVTSAQRVYYNNSEPEFVSLDKGALEKLNELLGLWASYNIPQVLEGQVEQGATIPPTRRPMSGTEALFGNPYPSTPKP